MSARAALKAVRDEEGPGSGQDDGAGQQVISAAHESAVATETDTGPVYMMNQMDADEVEAWDRDNQEWSRLCDTERALEFSVDTQRVATVAEEWVPGMDRAKANAQVHRAVMQVGQNKYQDDSGLTAFGGHPGELLLDQPLIARTGDKVGPGRDPPSQERDPSDQGCLRERRSGSRVGGSGSFVQAGGDHQGRPR